MIKEYDNLLFIKEFGYYREVYDGIAGEVVFTDKSINDKFENLLASAPLLYSNLNGIFTIASNLKTALDQERKNVPTKEGLEGLTAITTIMDNIQDICLNAMRVAEVGVLQVVKELNADTKSKPRL